MTTDEETTATTAKEETTEEPSQPPPAESSPEPDYPPSPPPLTKSSTKITDALPKAASNDDGANNEKGEIVPIVEDEGPPGQKETPFGASTASSLLGGTAGGGVRQGPLLAKLSSWGKQAGGNAKDLLSRARTSQWKAPSVVPAGGILGSALLSSTTTTTQQQQQEPVESAQLEQPSPTWASQQSEVTTTKEDDQDKETDVPEDSVPTSATTREWTESFAAPSDEEPPTMTQSLPGDLGRRRRRVQSSDSAVSSHEDDDDIAEDGSSTISSFYSSTYTESHEGGGSTSFKGTFRWAAASVVDSVQTYRGRYNSNNGNTATAPLSSPVPLVKTLSASTSISQTQRILQSRAGDHVTHLMQGLDHHEYIMLLGQGLLGVNLKATYLQNRGVYVDYLVPHGAAAHSQVIQPGDALIRVGDTDVQRSTIYKVPKQIAAAPRPVHLVLATGLPVKHLYEMGHLDVAVGLLHQWQEEQKRQEEKMETPSRSNIRHLRRETMDETPPNGNSQDDDDSQEAVTGTTTPEAPTDEEGDSQEDVVALVHPTSFDSCESAARPVVPDLPSMADLLDRNQDQTWFCFPPPANDLRQICREDATRRCSDLSVTTSAVQAEPATLERSLQHALLEVVADYRKRSFWERHIKALAASNPSQPPPAALLVLFLELWDFKQYYTFMDENQRATFVHRIAHTYFLPTTDAEVGMVPPLLDFHSLVGDTSLREIEAVLKHQKPLTSNVFRDCFEAAVEELARDAFLQFVQSEECARMRGHMRHTGPFWNVPLPVVVDRLCGAPGEKANAQNFAIYILTYLLCQTDNEGIGELIDLDDSKSPRTRIEGAATGFCAALFIKRAWLSAVRSGEREQILKRYQQLWDTYLSPSVGSLAMTSLSTKAALTLDAVLERLQAVRSSPDAADPDLLLPLLVDDVLVNRIHQLGKDMLHDYARNAHPKFMVHRFHEWMSQEAAKLLSDDHPETFESIPRLPTGSIKRFLRRVEFPAGVSSHKPSRHGSDEMKPALSAECAVIFGNNVGLDIMGGGTMENDADLRRYACQGLDCGTASPLLPENIPPTLEAYATVPMSTKQPMSNYVNQNWISSDGWEIALVNFVLPRTDMSNEDGGDGSLYGVSLFFQRSLSAFGSTDSACTTAEIATRLVCGTLADDDSSPMLFEEREGSPIRKVTVDDCDISAFNACLQERTWRERIVREVRPDRTTAKMGLALVSQNNVIVSMRETLSNLLHDFSRDRSDKNRCPLICGPLVDVLGNFANQDVDATVISGLLRSYLAHSNNPWIERPVCAQKEAFESAAGEQMVNSLPPIALAMMFVTALLEQKIVITSNRRGLLLSSTTALKLMLQPLNWCHLIVPRVPANLAADLLQYPAPFILGLPSDEPGVMELVRSLPEEVTLVDLDVGRVILAPSFAHASELGRGSSSGTDSLTALRSQVLYLAQSLGTVFGASIDSPLWACDRPTSARGDEQGLETTRFGRLRRACTDFIEELLAGTSSCCYWIEESAGQISDSRSRSDPTVFFDEDHFFHLKNKRSQEPYEPLFGGNSRSTHLSLALEDFDLIFELFLRCQSMSMYIGGLDQSRMVYSG